MLYFEYTLHLLYLPTTAYTAFYPRRKYEDMASSFFFKK